MKMQVFLKISVLQNFPNFSRKHLRWETTCNLIKKRLQLKYFPIKFSKAPFSTEQLQRLLFKINNRNNLFKDAKSLTHNQSLTTWNSHNDKLIRQSIFVTDLEQTPFFLKSDLNINNFAVLLHFLITQIFSNIWQKLPTSLSCFDQNLPCYIYRIFLAFT